MHQISGYEIVEQLYSGSRTVVYRAFSKDNQTPVILKFFQKDYPTFSELVQFRNQYTIGKNLNIPGTIKIYGLEFAQNRYILSMEDFGGISLTEYLTTNNRSLSLEQFLNIARHLAQVLQGLHEERIIHKDIKPANILINPETQEVKITDFSISSLLPRETQEIQNPNILEGTLGYISPEQTGRMNRGTDYRTDFYSLGVTFYEILTGQLPFVTEDAMELVHCHLAKQAVLIHEVSPKIPVILSQIVAKLMAKNAEDRYQSAFGLRHDLEICLTQLQETGEITGFALGQRDLTDAFIIPEKLYGRETEVEDLLAAFERVSEGSAEMILVAGFSGIGKTAVVNEVHKPIVRQRGYFVKGKYDQFQRNIPFSAFVQAFRDLMGQLLSESEAKLQVWKDKILEAVGENGQVLIEVIPELERIIGTQPTATELSGTAAQNRFNLLMQKFIKVFTSQEHPLVMFLDDLQWSDSASLNLLQLLMNDTKHLLILGAYRDNEVSSVHPFITTVNNIVKAGATVNTITLQPLSLNDMNRLVADTLSCEVSLAQPLTELVYRKTKGNPFFATQFLKALHQDGLITFNWDIRHWQCDIAEVRALAITDDVVEFMALQLQKLPSSTQGVLKLAACIGAQFDLDTLAIVSEKSSAVAAAALWRALQEGLIIPNTEIYKFFMQSDSISVTNATANPTYRFLHDRVQQAAYSLIPNNEKQATHLKIGQLLQENSSDIEQEEKLFDIVGHLNIGKSLITQTGERTELAQLNLAAGKKARLSTAYDAAIDYFTKGIELLEENSWQSQYELTLALHTTAAEVAYLSGQFDQMEAIASATLKYAKTLLDKIAIYEIQIQAYTAQNRPNESIETALNILNQLGVHLPKKPNISQTLLGLAKTKLILAGKKTSDLLNQPIMSNPEKMAAIRILTSTGSAAAVVAPKLFPLLILQSVNLSVQYGNSPLSAVAYTSYGIILGGVLGDIDGSYGFGELALQVLEKFNGKNLHSKTLYIANGYIFHWKQHLRYTLSGLQESYQVGLETGDLEYSSWAITVRGKHLYWTGHELSDLGQTLHNYAEAITQAKQHLALVYVNIHRQSVLNLRGESANPSILDGSAYAETQNAIQEAAGDYSGLFFYYVNQTYLSYLFGEVANACQQATLAKKYIDGCVALYMTVPFYLYDSLSRLGLYPHLTKSERQQILRHISKNQQKLHKWAGFTPMNTLHKWCLVEAERYRVLGSNTEAMAMYDRAISGAKENEYIQEEALANELAAKFYLEWGKEKIAQTYMIGAYYCYSRWGAKAKVTDLETLYPQLLQPILQQPKSSFNPLETLASITYSATQVSSTSISDSLDFASVIQAAQSLSSAIELDELLKQLTQIILQNSGGSKCALVLPQDDIWQVRAICTLETTELCSEPLEEHPDVPIKLIQYVKRTQSVVVIDDLQTDLPVIDDYLIQSNPKSILCLPILNQGHLVGILYLINQSTAGVFTSDRLTIIEFLCTQAAISLENARLYQQLEHSLQDIQQKSQNLAEALALSDGQQQIMALIVQRVSLDTILAEVARFIESQTHHPAYCSFLLIDTEERLRCAAAPNLPAAYNALIDGVKIGPEVGSCGTAAYYKASVTVTDIATDPLWSNYQVALDFGLQACASTPILGAEGQVLATLAMYQPVAGEFTLHDRKLMEVATYLARISIERYQADMELKNAQLQMVQSEKMSALGNLVAGVAHEINNPVGFLGGNIEPALDYINGLFGLLDLYQQQYPQPNTDIQEKIAAIDLDYIREDLPKLVGSMREGVKRIADLSTSLRTFSRADTDRPVACNIHDGINSTIMILKHRLKANENRPEIEVIKNYGNLPKIECYAGQLNQVFMNLLANAIDALDESNYGKKYAEIQQNPNSITITTSVEDNYVEIAIADNGKGMSKEVKQKVFDHLFTTKEVGKGTGLGLAIAQQIVVEKHGGSLEVQSELGQGTEFCIRLAIAG